MSIVSSKGVLVNNDFTSKLAKKNDSENLADCNSLENSIEILTVVVILILVKCSMIHCSYCCTEELFKVSFIAPTRRFGFL